MKPRNSTPFRSHASITAAFSVALFSHFAAPTASAVTGTWLGTSGDWTNAGTWSGGTIADGAGFTANFTGVDIAADETITLTAPQTIGNITFTDATTSSNNLTVTGANLLTLDVALGVPAINVTQSGRSLTINSVIAGAEGLQKTGAGALTLNGSAVNTFTGGLNVNGGTLALDYNTLAIPTDLVSASNVLQINNGALTITGKNLAAATSAQTFASATFNTGRNNIVIAKGASAASATLNLGILTVNPGSVTAFSPTTAWTTTASITERVFIAAGGSVPTLPGSGSQFINALFHRTSASAGAVRWAAVNSSGQLLAGTAITNLVAGTGSTPTTPVQFQGAASLALTNTAVSTYGLLLNTTSNGLILTLAAGGTYTLNSIIQQQSANAVTIAPGTGASNLIIGSERNLVLNMDNGAGLTINAPIANNGGGASSVTIASTAPSGTTPGNIAFGGANTYSGATYVINGTLTLTNALALQNTSGITLGGASAATLTSSLPAITISAPITTANTGIASTISYYGGSGGGSIALDGAIGGTGNVAYTTPNASSGGNQNSINLGEVGAYAGSTNLNTGNQNNNLTLRNSAGAADVLPTSTVLTFGTGIGPASATRTTTFDLNGRNQTLAGLGSLAAVAVPNGRNHRVSSTAAATLTINSATDQTFGGTTVSGSLTTSAQITGAISLVKNGAGTFTLGGLLTGGATASGNSFTGSTKVLGGILVLGQSDSIKDSAFDTDGSIAGNAANGLRTTPSFLRIGGLTGGNDFATRFTTAGGNYTTLTGLTLNPGTGATLTYSGDVGNGAGAMNLTKSGAGTQILAAAQSYTGTTTGTAGALVATTTAALPGYNVPGKMIFNGGAIGAQVGGAGWTTAEVDTLLSNATKTSGALGIDTTNGNLVQWTPFTTNFGALGLNKLGAGDLTLDQANTYTGATTVTAGTLTLTNANALQNSALVTTGAGTVILSGVTTLNLSGLSGTTGDLGTVISSGYSGVTALTLNTPAGALLNYGGNIAEGATGMTVTKTGLGIQALSGTNTYTGATQINDGILVFRTKASKAAGTATAAAAGTIGLGVKAADAAFYSAIEVGDLFNATLTGFVLAPASGVAIDTTAASFDQTVSLTAARSLTKLGANTLTLSQVNSYSGATNVTTGTLSLTGSLTGGGAISTSGTSVLTQSAAGIISGASTFTQGSSGTSSLAGANTYTGATTVSAGTLALVGGSQTSPITVNNLASLGFTLGSPTTSTAAVTFDTGSSVKITGTPVPATGYTLLTTTATISGPLTLTPLVPGFQLQVDGGNTLKLVPVQGYTSWASLNGAGVNLDDDHDNDGVDNGAEYFIGGPTGSTTGFTPLPGVTNSAGVLSVTWTKAGTYTGTYGTDFSVETSSTLTGVWTTETLGVNVTITGNEVKYTFPAGTINFARLKVTGP